MISKHILQVISSDIAESNFARFEGVSSGSGLLRLRFGVEVIINVNPTD